MKPLNSSNHDPRPEYIRELLARAGLTQNEAARLLGASPRMVRYWVALEPEKWRPAPYSAQFCLETLAERCKKNK